MVLTMRGWAAACIAAGVAGSFIGFATYEYEPPNGLRACDMVSGRMVQRVIGSEAGRDASRSAGVHQCRIEGPSGEVISVSINRVGRNHLKSARAEIRNALEAFSRSAPAIYTRDTTIGDGGVVIFESVGNIYTMTKAGSYLLYVEVNFGSTLSPIERQVESVVAFTKALVTNLKERST